MTLIYIKGEANVGTYVFSRILMVHHTHKLVYIDLEEEICGILCLGSLFVSDNTDYYSLDIEDIPFLLAPHILEVEQNL